MTIVEDAPQTEVLEPVAPSAPSTRAPARRPVPIAVAVVCMLAALATCWSLLALAEGPFGRAWYETRQSRLAANLKVPSARVLPGQALGVLQIPRLGINVVVQEGDDVQHLRSGPGHHAGTPRPGQLGNSVIVGHKSGWGGPFGELHWLRRFDLIAFQGRDGKTWVYKVRSVASGVAAGDAAPFAASNEHRLTLITGSGGRFSDRRLVVTAVSGAPAGKKLAFGPPASPRVPGVSTLANEGVGLIAVGIVLGLVVLGFTRRRYRRATAAVIAAPFVVLALLGLLLELDLMLPALH
jgi:LPXTG-site transpeptidase (sortase) family protein